MPTYERGSAPCHVRNPNVAGARAAGNDRVAGGAGDASAMASDPAGAGRIPVTRKSEIATEAAGDEHPRVNGCPRTPNVGVRSE